MVKKLYFTHSGAEFVVSKEHPEWNSEFKCWDHGHALWWFCEKEMMELFPKIKPRCDEFFELPIPKGTVWGHD